jgi:hypothetical protein
LQSPCFGGGFSSLSELQVNSSGTDRRTPFVTSFDGYADVTLLAATPSHKALFRRFRCTA